MRGRGNLVLLGSLLRLYDVAGLHSACILGLCDVSHETIDIDFKIGISIGSIERGIIGILRIKTVCKLPCIINSVIVGICDRCGSY